MDSFSYEGNVQKVVKSDVKRKPFVVSLTRGITPAEYIEKGIKGYDLRQHPEYKVLLQRYGEDEIGYFIASAGPSCTSNFDDAKFNFVKYGLLAREKKGGLLKDAKIVYK